MLAANADLEPSTQDPDSNSSGSSNGDAARVKRALQSFRASAGHLALFVPAEPEAYAKIQ